MRESERKRGGQERKGGDAKDKKGGGGGGVGKGFESKIKGEKTANLERRKLKKRK